MRRRRLVFRRNTPRHVLDAGALEHATGAALGTIQRAAFGVERAAELVAGLVSRFLAGARVLATARVQPLDGPTCIVPPLGRATKREAFHIEGGKGS